MYDDLKRWSRIGIERICYCARIYCIINIQEIADTHLRNKITLVEFLCEKIRVDRHLTFFT